MCIYIHTYMGLRDLAEACGPMGFARASFAKDYFHWESSGGSFVGGIVYLVGLRSARIV